MNDAIAENTKAFWIMLVALVILADIVLMLIILRPFTRKRAWETLAKATGLTIHFPDQVSQSKWLLAQIRRPRDLRSTPPSAPCRIYQDHRLEGSRKTPFIVHEHPLKVPAHWRFSLNAASANTESVRNLGMPLVLTGDPQFDAAIVLKARPETPVKQILLPEIRQALLVAFDHKNARGLLKLADATLRYSEVAQLAHQRQIPRHEALHKAISVLAEALEAQLPAS